MASKKNLPRVEDLVSRFEPPATELLGKTLLGEGFLMRQGRTSSAVVDRWCFLFDDLFVFTKPNKNHTLFEMKQKCDLRNTIIDVRRNDAQGKPVNTKIPYFFKLTAGEKEDESFICGSDDNEVMLGWADDISNAIFLLLKQENNPITEMFGWQHNIYLGTLFYASFVNDLELARGILSSNPNLIDEIEENFLTASHIACRQGFPDMMALLLEFSPNLRFSSPLVHCSRLPIHLAAWEGHADVLEVLLDYDKELANLQDSDGNTALHLTVMNPTFGSPDCIINLVSVGIDPNEFIRGSSLLHRAVEAEKINIAKALLNSGASVDILDNAKQTPLHIAVGLGLVNFVQLLIENGAQVNRTSTFVLPVPPSASEAPVQKFRVMDSGNYEVVALLIQNGGFIPEVLPTLSNPESNGKPLSDASILGRLKIKQQEFNARPVVPGDSLVAASENAHWPAYDDNVPACSICCDEFSLLNRRHHCRRCAALMCGACSVIKVEGSNNSKVRVCTGCFNYLYYSREERIVHPEPIDQLEIPIEPKKSVLENIRTLKDEIKHIENKPDTPDSVSDRIREKYGIKSKPPKASPAKGSEQVDDKIADINSSKGLAGIAALLNTEKMAKNIEQAKIVEEKSNIMQQQASSFGDFARQLKEREKKNSSWFGF